ncbi:MAG: DUF4351 domain-containing protein [Gammaproteobacteria bacterium]|nr:DUF4351 domain-containing protein [Gammaproteobacteria bacterium]
MVWKWVRRLLPSPTPRLEEHVSVWSIRRRDAGTFFMIVGALWLVGLARIGYKAMERSDAPQAGWASVVDFALVVWGEFGTVAVGAAAMAMLLTRPVNMLGGTAMTLYQAMVNRYVIPVIERHKAEGRAEGLAEGIAEGIERGRVDGERTVLERQLLRRFGSISPEVAARVGEASAVDLEAWAERVLDADTPEEVIGSNP